MHISKTIIIISSGLGIFSTLLPWRTFDIGSAFGFPGIESGMVEQTGIDAHVGYISILMFVVVISLCFLNKRDRVLEAGFQKMGILITSALSLVFLGVMVSAYMVQDHQDPAYGIYLAFAASLVCLIAPFLFKKDGSFDVPSVKEAVKDVKESAEIVEDKIEDLGDKIEDRFEKKKEDKKSSEEDDMNDQERTSTD